MTAAACSLTPAQRSLSLAAVIVSTFGVGISYGIGYPITALTFERWDAPSWLTGLAGSMPALAIFLLLPFFPRLVGRLGTVVSMSLGCMVVGGGFLLMPLLPSVESWLILRFVMGAGLALPWLVGETWINTVTAEETRGRVVALYAIALFSGYAAGPMLLEAVGIDGWTPFVLGAAGILLAVLPIVIAARLAPEMPRQPETGMFGVVRLVPVAMIGALLGGFLELGYFALLPVYAVQSGLGESEALRLLTVLMVGGIVLQFGIGWLADRVARRALLIVLALVFAALATASAAMITAPVLGAATLFLLGGVLLGFYTLALAIIGERVRHENLAVANAAFLIAYQAGAIVGPGIGGAVMSVWPPHGFAAVMVAASLFGAAGAALARTARCAAAQNIAL